MAVNKISFSFRSLSSYKLGKAVPIIREATLLPQGHAERALAALPTKPPLLLGTRKVFFAGLGKSVPFISLHQDSFNKFTGFKPKLVVIRSLAEAEKCQVNQKNPVAVSAFCENVDFDQNDVLVLSAYGAVSASSVQIERISPPRGGRVLVHYFSRHPEGSFDVVTRPYQIVTVPKGVFDPQTKPILIRLQRPIHLNTITDSLRNFYGYDFFFRFANLPDSQIRGIKPIKGGVEVGLTGEANQMTENDQEFLEMMGRAEIPVRLIPADSQAKRYNSWQAKERCEFSFSELEDHQVQELEQKIKKTDPKGKIELKKYNYRHQQHLNNSVTTTTTVFFDVVLPYLSSIEKVTNFRNFVSRDEA